MKPAIKRTLSAAAAVLFLLLSAGCADSSRLKSRQELLGELLHLDSCYTSLGLRVYECRIVSRLTSLQTKHDYIELDIRASNQTASCRITYGLTYCLDDGGWQLEACSRRTFSCHLK